MKTALARTVLVSLLVLVSFAAAGCGDFSCFGLVSDTTGSTTVTTLSTTTTLPPTTTSSTTSTTLSPMDTYRAAMKVWAATYGPGLSQAYSVIRGANFMSPTAAQVQAAKDLDALMSRMIPDLRSIDAPPEVSQAHADFLASLEKMAEGVHDLSQAFQEGRGLMAVAAAAAIAAAWQEGSSARSTLEQVLGFSLSG
jgi:hypothetical protein